MSQFTHSLRSYKDPTTSSENRSNNLHNSNTHEKRWKSPTSGKFSTPKKKRTYTPPPSALIHHHHHNSSSGRMNIERGDNDTQQFWSSLLSTNSPSNSIRKITPTRRKSTTPISSSSSSSYLTFRQQQQQQNISMIPQNQQQQQIYSTDLEDSDVARMEEMLVTGLYQPSLRISKLESMLSRELEMWDHVVVGTTATIDNNKRNLVGDSNYNATSNYNTYSNNNYNNNIGGLQEEVATTTQQQDNSQKLSTAALTALFEINEKQKQELHAKEDKELKDDVQDKLIRLDEEVAAVDVECQTLIGELVQVQAKQQRVIDTSSSNSNSNAHQEVDAVNQLNNLFHSVQKALARSQERREKLMEMRHKLLTA